MTGVQERRLAQVEVDMADNRIDIPDSLVEGISRTAPLPYYAQLAQILRGQIAGGRWRPGDILPSEADLCSMYELSRTAVRQALDELVMEGLVQKEKGRGTFVSHPKISKFVVQEVKGFFDEMTSKGETVTTEILKKELVIPPADVAEALGLQPGDQCIEIQRIRKIEAEPIVEVQTYLPFPRFARLLDIDMTPHSLYRTLASDFDVIPSGGRKHIYATAAHRELADHLRLDIGAPTLKLVAVNVDQSGEPFEYFVAWYRGDRTSFEVQASSEEEV